MIKGMIFDLDGLLVNTEVVSYQILKQILADFGHDFSMKDYATNYSGMTDEVNIATLLNNFRIPLSFEECFNKIMNMEAELLKEGVDLMPGALELLTYLKDNGIKMALASSSTKERAVSLLNQHDILEMFDIFVLAEDVSHGKPNPEVFLKVQEKLQVGKDECFVLEDSENGIEAGHRAGIPVICIPDIKMPKDEYLNKSEYVVKSLKDVIEIVEHKK